ncbi:MAG: glycosyltransferase family 1 protein, partial [Chloroflexi bacterium]
LYGAPPEKVTVLYSGVDTRFTPRRGPGERDRLRARYGLPDAPFILSVGTLQPRKNYVRLIRAFHRLTAMGVTWEGVLPHLVIAGGRGWLFDAIFAEGERLGVADRVHFPGFVAEEDLPALYRSAALFAFPSLYEGFGLPILEAMACGVPVVASNASSLPEVVGEAGLLVEPTDEEGLAQAMARLLTDRPLREALIRRGLDQARRFTWPKAAEQLVALYHRLLADGRPAL